MSGAELFSIFTKKAGNPGNQGTEEVKTLKRHNFSSSPPCAPRFPKQETGEPACFERGTEKDQQKQSLIKPSSPVPRFPSKTDEIELAEREAIMTEDGGLPKDLAQALALITTAPCPVEDQGRWLASLDTIISAAETRWPDKHQDALTKEQHS